MKKLNLDNLIIDSIVPITEANDVVTFSVNDDKLDQLLNDFHARELGFVNIKGDDYYTLPQRDFDRFIDAADSKGFNVDYANNEDSVISIMESDSAHTSTESKTQPLLQIEEHEMDEVLAEWFYRLPKGYAEEPYSNADLYVLEQCIHEFRNGGFKPIINEAREGTKRSKTAVVEPKSVLSVAKNFVKFLPEEKHALLVKFIEDIPYQSLQQNTINFLASLKGAEAEKYANSFKTLTGVKKLNDEQYTDYKPLWNLNVEKAMGRGELYIAFRVKGAITQGSSASYDVAVGSKHYEVKSLDAGEEGNRGSIRPGAEGKASRHPYFTNPLMSLAGTIHAMKDPEIQAAILKLGDPEKMQKVLDIINATPTVRPKSGNPITETPGDVPISVMGALYKAAVALKSLRPGATGKDVTSSRITVKNNDTAATYWITPDDVSDIVKAAGKNKSATIKVGTKVTDESKDAKILLVNLLNHPFVKKPSFFTEGLSNIKAQFFGDKAGLVYFLKGITYVSDTMSEFATTESSQDGYKFDLKSNYSKWPHVQAQD